MRRVFAFAILSVLLTSAARAQDSPSAPDAESEPAGFGPSGSGPSGSGHLFITSSVLRAEVVLNGERQGRLTPLLMRDLPAGRHHVEVRKEGYRPVSEWVVVRPSDARRVALILDKTDFHASFPNEGMIYLDGEPDQAVQRVYHFRPGTYQFTRQDNILHIDRVGDDQRAVDVLNLVAPLAVVLSGLLTISDLAPGDTVISPVTYAMYGLSACLIAIDVGLNVRRALTPGRDIIPIDFTDSIVRSIEYYDAAEAELTSGSLAGALDYLDRITRTTGESPVYPYAVYKTAKIHSLTGQPFAALAGYQRVASLLPLAELYDKSLKNMADMYRTLGEYSAALESLDRIVFADPTYQTADMRAYASQLSAEWFDEAQSLVARGAPEAALRELQLIVTDPRVDTQIREKTRQMISQLAAQQ